MSDPNPNTPDQIYVPPADDNTVNDQPSQPQPINAPTTSGEVTGSGPGELLGYQYAASAASTVVLHDNASAASGTILATIEIAANSTALEMFKRGEGIEVEHGVYATITGTVTSGVIYQ